MNRKKLNFLILCSVTSVLIVALVSYFVVMNKENKPATTSILTLEEEVELAIKKMEESNKELEKLRSDVEAKQLQEPKEIDEALIAKIMAKAKKANLKDEKLNKWLLGTLLDAEVYHKDISLEEAIKKTKERYEYDKAWLHIAVSNYDIAYTEEEIDEWIANGPDKYDHASMKIMADALGLSVYELNHQFNRELYTQMFVWKILQPKLLKKYEKWIPESEYGNQYGFQLIHELYENEVNRYIASQK